MTTIRAVLFDMDGTLLEPIEDGLPEYKARWGIALGQLVIPNLPQLPEAARQEFQALEERVAAESLAREGTRALLRDLHGLGVKTAVVTNNSTASWRTVSALHDLRVDIAVSRDDGPQKPAPDLILRALEHFGLGPHEAVFVGDTRFDVDAARAALVPLCLLVAEPWNDGLEAREAAFEARRVTGMTGVRAALEALPLPLLQP